MNSDSDGVSGGDQPRRGEVPEDDATTASGAAAGEDGADDADDVLADLEADLDADLASDGEFDREPVTVGARATAGSARAAARASAARAGVTAAKGRPTPTRERGRDRVGVPSRVSRYLKEVVAELRKVLWPTRNEMVTYSVVVVLFLIFMIAVTWGADFGFARLILLIFG